MELTHHAYVFEGPTAALGALRADAQKRLGLAGEHSPDVHERRFERFGIEESRWLSGAAALRSASGKALFALSAASITSEAQQALLKLFEEPQRGVVFLLAVPHGTLLPTLRSRLLPYPFVPESAETSDEAREFLKAAPRARSALIAGILDDEEGEKERVRALLLGLEEALRPRMKDPKVREGLGDIARVRSYVADRSASLKMLLEHLAVSLPKL